MGHLRRRPSLEPPGEGPQVLRPAPRPHSPGPTNEEQQVHQACREGVRVEGRFGTKASGLFPESVLLCGAPLPWAPGGAHLSEQQPAPASREHPGHLELFLPECTLQCLQCEHVSAPANTLRANDRQESRITQRLATSGVATRSDDARAYLYTIVLSRVYPCRPYCPLS
jgi:hypothetical protein